MFFCGLGRTFFFTIMTCSTSTLPLEGNTRSTRPVLPLSRPLITFTWSLRLISTRTCMFSLYTLRFAGASQDFRREGNNLQELLFAQLARHRSKHAGSYRLAGIVDEHRRVLVKADVGPVTAAMFLA